MTADWKQQRAGLRQRLQDASGIPALAAVAREFPAFQASMQLQAVDAVEQARQTTGLMDRLTRRIIHHVVAGRDRPAPGAWAWLACGSQGRGEQTVHTDQDNALVYADGLAAAADEWFSETARQISKGLDACGLAYCPGGVGPANQEWRRPVSSWRRAMLNVIRYPENRAVMLATHYLDLRVIDGPAELFDPLRNETLTVASDNRRFMARLRHGATRPAPPLNVFGRLRTAWFGKNAGRLDLKQGGILPLVQLARCYAVRGGLPALHTLDRLQQAQAAGLLSEAGADALREAYTSLTRIRARLHAESIQDGKSLHNQLPISRMTSAEQSDLRCAFRSIATMQQALRQAVLGEGL